MSAAPTPPPAVPAPEAAPPGQAANPFRGRAAALRARINALTGATPHDRAMREAFPLGTGRPGNASSRRTAAQAEKRIGRSVDRAVEANRLVAEEKELLAKAGRHDAGLVDDRGLPAAGAQAARQAADAAVAAYLKATLRPGSTAYVDGNPVRVKRVNPTGITTESGSRWSYDDLLPAHPEGRAMTPRELAAAVRARATTPGVAPAPGGRTPWRRPRQAPAERAEAVGHPLTELPADDDDPGLATRAKPGEPSDAGRHQTGPTPGPGAVKEHGG